MSLPPFTPNRATPKSDPGEGDDVACVNCGAVALDTGLECSECGHDNYEAVTGRPFGAPVVIGTTGMAEMEYRSWFPITAAAEGRPE